ncbi:GMC family oxidoreductase [Emcibacter sp. SYSU 3D8]|uniref:GMC family oxidoreductase n=1 Tax=Emcibacter sp. SYSU 3D8 TaxID=3133969 RepID=UPI0031FE4DBA
MRVQPHDAVRYMLGLAAWRGGNMINGIIDMRSDAAGDVIDADICIIGAGPAGMTLALELEGTGRRVCLLNSGGQDDSGDALRGPIDVIGRPYTTLGTSRAFRLGGTSGLWGGHCVKLSPLEMGERDWIPGSAWPVSHDELSRYYPRALETVGLPDADFDAVAVARDMGAKLLPMDSGFENVVSHYNALDFGKAHAARLAAAPNMAILVNGTATRLVLGDTLDRVAGVTVKVAGGRMRTIHAATVVLAAGGIENARLLLASNEQLPAGIGNAHDVVGRYFMDHLGWFRGILAPSRPYDLHADYPHYWQQVPFGDHEVRFHVAATDDLARRLRIPQFRAELFLRPLLGWAVRSVLLRPGSHGRDTIAAAAAEVARHPAGLARLAAGQRGAPWCFHLCNHVEQIPNPSSRVTLSARRDALGEPLAALDWRLSSLDRDGVTRAHAVLADMIARSGMGRLIWEPEAEGGDIMKGTGASSHHMGTTRMSHSPRAGVVDANSRVHGVGNLYVAGSSVFPSGGWANPTLTIVALSIRLADHLKAGHAT